MDTASQSILEAADALFYTRGIAGVGMADIRDEARVSLRRLYRLYPSKRDLVAAWLEDRHHRWMDWFVTASARFVALGVDPLLAPFDAIGEWASAPEYRGCAFINAIAEPNEIDERHVAIVTKHKQALIDHVVAQTAVSRPNSPVWLPAALACMIDGVIVACSVFRSTAPLAATRNAVERLLAASS